jgi:hypothetical protein
MVGIGVIAILGRIGYWWLALQDEPFGRNTVERTEAFLGRVVAELVISSSNWSSLAIVRCAQKSIF